MTDCILRRVAITATLLGAALAFDLPALAQTSPATKHADPPTTHDPNLYLFVDDRWIGEQRDVARVLNQAEVLPDPIIWPDDPKTQRECAWGNVIREKDGQFRLWYVTMMMGHKGEGPHEMAKAGVWGRGEDFTTFHPRSQADVRDTETMLARYATSADGVEWARPDLGLCEFRGSRKNNILFTGDWAARQTGGALTNFDGYTILRDDAEPDAKKRYKMMAHWESVHFWDNHEVSGSLGRPADVMKKYAAARGKYVTYSPDGLDWDSALERIKFPDGGGDRFLVLRDQRNSLWWAYSRDRGWGHAAWCTSKDLYSWSKPIVETELSAEKEKYPAIECLISFNYGNQDIGFVVGMDKPKGILLSYLASHHDGQPWKWVEREQPFIAAGKPGSYCATGAVPLHNELFIVGNHLFIYFNAFAYHQQPPCPQGARSIGLARLRRDSFAGLKAMDGREAVLLTKPLKVTAPNLALNVELPKQENSEGTGKGSVEVALFRKDRSPIAGFGLEDAVPIAADGVRQRVAWKTKRDLSSLLGEEVIVQVRLKKKAVLYAIGFENDQVKK